MKKTSVLVSLVLILCSVTFGLCWPQISNVVAFEQLRYRVFECESFSPGLSANVVRNQYGVPTHVSNDETGEQWVYHFQSEAGKIASPLAGIVTLSFDRNGLCKKTNAMIGLRQTDRLVLWRLIQKRKELGKIGDLGNSEKLLAMQFGGAPHSMGYPEQSESARNTFGLVLESGSD